MAFHVKEILGMDPEMSFLGGEAVSLGGSVRGRLCFDVASGPRELGAASVG